MSLRLKASLEGKLTEHMARVQKDGEKAMRRGMEKTAKFGQTRLRDQITGAGLGRKLSKSWRMAVYPQRGKATLAPAALIYSKAKKIVEAHSGTTIRSKNGDWLAIPTDVVPKKGTDGKKINPSNFPEDRFGPLRFVFRGNGRPSLLVIDHSGITAGGRAKSRRITNRKAGTSRLRAKGGATVVAFILVPRVRLRKKLNIEAVRRQLENMLPREIVKEWNRIDDD